MKTLIKIHLLAMLALLVSLPAFGQGRSADTYGGPRTLSITKTVFTSSGTLANAITNGPYDIREFDGIGKVDVLVTTNSGTTGATLTAQLIGSVDQTNFTYVSAAYATNMAYIYTNTYYASATNGAITATNMWSLPYVPTSPTAATAGFATPYGAYPPQLLLTNTAALTLTIGTNNEIGFDIGDAPRYLYIVYTPGGTVSNLTAQAVLTGFTHQGQLW